MSHAPVAPKDQLIDEFNTVVAETEHLLKSVASLGNDKAGLLKSNLGEALASAGDRVAEIREKSLAQASAAAKATDDYVNENPWAAIGIAALVGGVAGLVTGIVIARR